MRYEDADANTVALVNKIIDESFPHLVSAYFKIIFDTKKRKTGDRYVFGRMKKLNEVERHLTADDVAENGVDYIMFLDKNVWGSIEEPDKIRLVRHELQHCSVNMEAEQPYKVRDHEVNDFYDELEFNKDDPQWTERLAMVAESFYSRDE